jgi:hypothetical protein
MEAKVWKEVYLCTLPCCVRMNNIENKLEHQRNELIMKLHVRWLFDVIKSLGGTHSIVMGENLYRLTSCTLCFNSTMPLQHIYLCTNSKLQLREIVKQ